MQVIVVSEPVDESRMRLWGEGRQATLAPRVRALKEKRYIFDRAFDSSSNTSAVYSQSVRVWLSCKGS